LLTVGRHAPKLADQAQGCKLRCAITIRSMSMDVAPTSLCQARFGFHCFDTNKLPNLPRLPEENIARLAYFSRCVTDFRSRQIRQNS
jgi:hypothetical protein